MGLQEIRPSDTIPPELFYPTKIHESEPKVKITLVIHSITHAKDNILHFTSSDCEFTNPVVKLLIDLGRIDKNNIKQAKPKQGEVIVTPSGKHKILSAILLKKHFEEFSAQDLCTVLKNVGDVIKRYKLKT